MHAPRLRISLALLLAVTFVTLPSFAQKTDHDPRPLQGVDHGHIPKYESLEAYLKAARPGNLLERATPIGYGNIAMKELLPPTALAKAATAGKTVTPLDVLRLDRAPNGTVRWMSGKIRVETIAGSMAGKTGAAAARENALAVLETLRAEMRLESPRDELQPMRIESDELGYTHARFEQVYQGVPVWGRDLYVHFDEVGDVYAINGTYEPTPRELSVTPRLSAAAALHGVIARLQAESRWAPLPEDVARRFDIPDPDARLVIYPGEGRSMRLAYEVTLHPNVIEWHTFIIDANDGSVLNEIQRHCAVDHEAEVPVIGVGGFAEANVSSEGMAGTFVDANGVDLHGVNQTLRVYQHDDGMYYKIWDLPNFNVNASRLPNELTGGAITLSLENKDFGENAQFFHVRSNNNTWTDPSGVSAAVSMRITYDYFKDTYGRNAIDGKDQSIISILHATIDGRSFDNAFWTGRYMIYGDGDVQFFPLAGALDVAGHEMSHGVIEHTANLVYQFQPGALNESFADVFGSMVDREDQLLGEDIMRPGQGIALRDLLNPGNPQLASPQPAHMNEYMNLTIQQDNGGVHINSGIPNRAAALIVNAIGHDKTEQIYYRALSSYLTRNSQFGDARKAVVQAATDLHGANSPEVSAVHQGFDAVGITDGTTGEGGGGGGTVPPQQGGSSYITFMVEDGSIGLLNVTNPANPTIGLFESPNATARANIEIGDMSQLTTPSSGERIWFIDAQGRLAFIEVSSGEVSVFENLSLNQPGDLWTASVSPDESYVALVSAYVNDPNLYFFDGESISAIELRPEGTQEGVFIETIRYPDVVSWSPNPQQPRLAFDAYNEINLDAGVMSFWGMYEIDFASGKLYSLIPAQTSNVSVGNVAYSKSSGDVIAFNYIDEDGLFDVMVADFAAGEIFALEVHSYTYGGVQIADAQRPTFSPDDSFLAFSSPSLSAILFYDPQSGLNALDLPVAIYNPNWFMLGGRTGTDTDDVTELPSSLSLEGNYPNPFNPSTTIRFSVATTADVRLEVFDVLGRHVRTLLDGPVAAGQHAVTFEAAGLASGTYVARLVAGREVASHRMILVR